jgi:hypothetical protein
MGRVGDILAQMPKWREERLPPPRVSQSEVSILSSVSWRPGTDTGPQYDKVGLTCKCRIVYYTFLLW